MESLDEENSRTNSPDCLNRRIELLEEEIQTMEIIHNEQLNEIAKTLDNEAENRLIVEIFFIIAEEFVFRLLKYVQMEQKIEEITKLYEADSQNVLKLRRELAQEQARSQILGWDSDKCKQNALGSAQLSASLTNRSRLPIDHLF